MTAPSPRLIAFIDWPRPWRAEEVEASNLVKVDPMFARFVPRTAWEAFTFDIKVSIYYNSNRICTRNKM